VDHSHKNSQGYRDRMADGRERDMSSESKRYGAGNWRNHRMDKSNRLDVGDSWRAGMALRFPQPVQELCLTMEILQ
jgi:hypothetical protein